MRLEKGRELPATSPASAPRPPTIRSRITNGRSLLPGIDGRSTLVRLATRLGINRQPRDVTPTLASYIASRYGCDSDEDAGEEACAAPQSGAGAPANEDAV
jgi:hypothetical protein